MKNTLNAVALVALPLITAVVHAEGDSPWLPVPGDATLSATYAAQTGDSAYIGATELSIPMITMGAADEYERTTTLLRLDYGFSDALAVDATLSYADVDTGAADSDSGLGDSTLGVRYRVADEYENGIATLTLRGALIIAGDYDNDRLSAIGKGENAVEYGVVVGKSVTAAWSLLAGVGGLSYEGEIPQAVYYDIGTRLRLAPGLTASLGYSDKRYGGNLDIGGPGFTPARFNEVKEERSLVKAGLGYGFGNQGVALNWAMLVEGRNTVNDEYIVSLSYGIGF